MKKLLIIALAAGIVGGAVASYDVPVWEATASPWGVVDSAANWTLGAVPFGSTTGLLSSVTLSAWGNDFYNDINLRIEGTGIFTTGANAGAPSTIPVTGGGDFALRGGTAAGLTTLIEVAGSAGALNLNIPQLTMWSQHGGNMTLSILSGEVKAENLNLVSGGKGTINMLDGNFYGTSWTGGDVNINMMTGGAGVFTLGDLNGVGVGATYINFESGNLGSITFLENGGASAGGNFEWAVLNNHVMIDGVIDNNLASYSISSTGGNDSTLSVIPEPATLGMVALLGGGILFIRKRFMI